MNLSEAIEARHSVRQYKNKPLEQDVVLALQTEIDACNRESGLHIQLVKDERRVFCTNQSQCQRWQNQMLAKAGVGFYTKVDLGIAKYHFEIGVGDHYFEWVL